MQRLHIGSVHLLQGCSEKLVQVDLGVPGVHHIRHCPFTGMCKPAPNYLYRTVRRGQRLDARGLQIVRLQREVKKKQKIKPCHMTPELKTDTETWLLRGARMRLYGEFIRKLQLS